MRRHSRSTHWGPSCPPGMLEAALKKTRGNKTHTHPPLPTSCLLKSALVFLLSLLLGFCWDSFIQAGQGSVRFAEPGSNVVLCNQSSVCCINEHLPLPCPG